MNMLSAYGAHLPPELTDLCDALLLPVSFVMPDVHGAPLVYANRPFEYLVGKKVHEILGLNYSFLRGPETDIGLSHEVEIAISQHQREAACVISYRADRSPFYHLLAFQPLELPGRNLLSIGCHAAFEPFSPDRNLSEDADAIDQAWRAIRRHSEIGDGPMTTQDIFRLEAISMRFEAVFTRAHNALIRRASTDMTTYLRYSLKANGQQSGDFFAGANRRNSETFGSFMDLGPLTRSLEKTSQ